MLKKYNIIFLLVLLSASCNQSQSTVDRKSSDTVNHIKSFTDTTTKKLKDGKIVLIIDSTFPCQLANPDTSVFDIILDDRKSSIKQVGEKFNPIEDNVDMPHENFCSKDKKQTLTLFFHYGGAKNEFSEFQVKKYSTSDSATTLAANTFVTNSRIALGISKEKVVSIFGNCFKTIKNEKAIEIIRYHIDDYGNSCFLKRYNYPSYYAEYEFLNDKLIRFRFGFEYP